MTPDPVQAGRKLITLENLPESISSICAPFPHCRALRDRILESLAALQAERDELMDLLNRVSAATDDSWAREAIHTTLARLPGERP